MDRSQASQAPPRPDETLLIGLGGNLPSPAGPPRATLEAAVARLPAFGIIPLRRSRWYRTTPVPASAQPSFVNGVVEARSDLAPAEILDALLRLEREFGRRRGEANAARSLDLDLLAYGSRRIATPDLTLPHPRLAERLFVMVPLAEILPGWRHSELGLDAATLLAVLRDAGGPDRVEAI